MNALHRLAFRLRAMRLDRLRAKRGSLDRLVYRLEKQQAASLKVGRRTAGSMATRTRPPVPEFLRRGRA